VVRLGNLGASPQQQTDDLAMAVPTSMVERRAARQVDFVQRRSGGLNEVIDDFSLAASRGDDERGVAIGVFGNDTGATLQ
jgi:hypothetical protein